MRERPVIVVALGGNALLPRGGRPEAGVQMGELAAGRVGTEVRSEIRHTCT